MADLVLTGKLLKWGNSYGLRISKADLARLEKTGTHVGDEMHINVIPKDGKIDVSWMTTFRGGDPFGSRDHDRIVEEAVEEEWKEKQRRIAMQEKRAAKK